MEDRRKTERLARTIIADFFLYNQDVIDRGLLNDNLFQILRGELEDSVNYFKERSDGDLTIFWDTLFNKLMEREAELMRKSSG